MVKLMNRNSSNVPNILKWASLLGFGFQIISGIFAALDYFLWQNTPIFLSQAAGILITLSFMWAFGYFALMSKMINLESANGQRLNAAVDFFLFLTLGTLVCCFFLATGAVWGFFVLLGFLLFMSIFHLVILGMLRLTKRNPDNLLFFRDPQSQHQNDQPAIRPYKQIAFLRIFRFFTFFIFTLLYIIGAILAHAQITGGDRLLGQVTGAAAGIASGFILLLVGFLTCTTWKMAISVNRPKIAAFMLIVGIVLGGIFSLPLLFRHEMIRDGDAQFSAIYGTNWNSFPASTSPFFLPAPYLHSQFYFGYGWDRLGDYPSSRYHYVNNLLYANHGEYRLYYDVKYPAFGFSGANSIGKNTTVILLHSGGWNGGDKGVDAVQITNHLAAQGYVIFDIQYRLLDSKYMDFEADFGFDPGWEAPPPIQCNKVYGNYSIQDMVADIGEFTHFLACLSESERFGANLDSVIMMGVSAGGHLAAITAYGYHHPYFMGTFSDALNIRAAVLYNPPNDANYFFYEGHPMYFPYLIRGTPEELPDAYYHYTPSNLVNESSVPTILFHGTIDKMVPPENSDQIYRALRGANRHAILLNGRFGGHGFDFGPWFSPVAMYYLERFLYLELHN
jgi:acetyl esterase/lipase